MASLDACCKLDGCWQMMLVRNSPLISSYGSCRVGSISTRVPLPSMASARPSLHSTGLHGVEASPELLEFPALVHAALALSVCVLAHNVSFNVARLNHTAHKFKLKGCLAAAAKSYSRYLFRRRLSV